MTHSYALPLEAGRGYVVTMQAGNVVLQSLLELATGGTSAETLLAASRGAGARAQLLFASAATATDTVRATTADSLPSDTGSYTIFVQSCKVPVPPVTDSITHSDMLTSGDCQVNFSAFNIGDNNVANVHLYAIHSTDPLKRRLVSFIGSARLRVFIGGPHDDTFGVTGGTEVLSLDTATTATAFYFVGSPGDYTLVIGADQSLPTVASYTLTIGREQLVPSLARSRAVGAREP